MKKVAGMVMALMLVIGLMIPVFASAESVAGYNEMWVNCSDGKRLNVRETPDRNGKLVKRLDCGTQVTILQDAGNGWAKIAAKGNVVGYVMTKFLVGQKPGKYEITEREDNFRAVTPFMVTALARGSRTAESVGLRTKPNKTASAVRRLMAGDQLQVIAVGNTWSQVKDMATGRVGYVANDYILRVL